MIRFVIWLFAVCFTFIAISGCGTAKVIQESVVVRDTVVVTKERTLTDTLILWRDTTIVQEGVKLRVEYIDRFVKVNVDCPSDTVVVTQTKVVYKQEVKEEKPKWLDLNYYIKWFAFILLLWITVSTLLKKYL